MNTVNNDPTIACPNANWNGTTTNYCNGVTSDDVVAHEWGHAYTEFTHGLIYQWQPGALNESYSDIWGETVDLINGRMDDDEGDIRPSAPDGECSTHTRCDLLVHQLPGRRSPDPATARRRRSARSSTRQGVTDDVVVGQDAATRAGPGHDRRLHAALQRAGHRRQLRLRRPRHLHLPGQGRQRRGRGRRRHRRRRQRRRGRLPIWRGTDPTITILTVHPQSDRDDRGKAARRTVNVTIRRQRRPSRGLLPVADGRGRDRVRWRDPRHVDAHLLRRPRQGLGRGVLLRHRRRRRRAQQLRRPQPRLSP